MLIFDCDDFQIIHRSGRPGLLVITFSSLGMFDRNGSLANGHIFWGQELANALDYSVFGFVAKERNWFCGPRMNEACKIVAERAAAYGSVVAYGSSMGGYAALRWGRQAGANTAIAFSPQYSIDPAVAVYDKRHAFAFRPGLHQNMEIRPGQVGSPSFVFFDPSIEADRQHAGLIRKAVPDINEIPMLLCGHECVRAFGPNNLGGELMDLGARGDVARVRDLAFRARKTSSIRIVELTMRAVDRKSALAQRLFNKYHLRFEMAQREAFQKRMLAVQRPFSGHINAAPSPSVVLPSGTPVHAAEPSPARGPMPRSDLMTPNGHPRIVHLHVPKTAGTAVRTAFEKQFRGSLRVFPSWEEPKFASVQPEDYDFYSGHIGFVTASRLKCDIVTVLRHPVDRYLSVYYFWRQLYESGVERSLNTELAWKFSLDEFVKIRDQPNLIEEFENRATCQIAYGSGLAQRRQMRQDGLTNDEIFATAVRNLETFTAVGIQEDMTRFADVIATTYGVTLTVEKINVTKQRQEINDLPISTCRAIQDWVYMDLELYQRALRRI